MITIKILFITWNCFLKQDIIDTLKELGHSVSLFEINDDEMDYRFTPTSKCRLVKKLKENPVNLIFSMNYFPTVSEAANEIKIKYISWVYDNPFMKLYSINIINECNYIFTFEKDIAQKLQQQHVKTVYYAPLAVLVSRLSSVNNGNHTEQEKPIDVSFVGSLYNEKAPFYKQLVEKLRSAGDHYTVGYLEAIIEAQLRIYGYYLLENSLTDSLMQKITAVHPLIYDEFAHFLEPKTFVSDFWLAKEVTRRERFMLLEQISSRFQTYLYTPNRDAQVGKCMNKGYVRYYDEMPLVFHHSKINLNITLKSIRTGIPLRALDIMASGGFLLSNYQEDLIQYFTPGQDFVIYESTSDAIQKIDYYLSNEAERIQIAENGKRKIEENFSLKKRLADMLSIVSETNRTEIRRIE